MSWAKLDDDFYGHPKVVALGNAGAGLFARLISYCARHLTDGHVPEPVMAMLAGDDGRRLVDHVLSTGVVERIACNPVTGQPGYHITGYLDRNPSAEAVRAERSRKAKNVAAHRANKAARSAAEPTGPAERSACNPVTNQPSNRVGNCVPVPVDLSSLRSERSPLTPPPGGPPATTPSAESSSDGEAPSAEALAWQPTPANDLDAGAAAFGDDRQRPAQRTPPSLNLPDLDGHQTPSRPDAQRGAAAGSPGPETAADDPRGRTPPPKPVGEAPRRRKRAPSPPRADLNLAELAEGPERATYEAILADPSLSKTVARPAETARDLARTASALFDPAAEVHEAGSWTRKKPGRERPNGAAYLANWFAKARRDAEVRRAVLETTRASGASSAQGAPAARQGSGFVPPVAPPMYRAPKGPTTP